MLLKNDIMIVYHLVLKYKIFLFKIKSFSPINFNPKIIQKTQQLKKLFTCMVLFFIFKKDIFLNNGLQRISKIIL